MLLHLVLSSIQLFLYVLLSSCYVADSEQENSTEEFRWVGSIPLLFTGEHYFRFEPSKKIPGGTTLIQGENFSGLLSFLAGPTYSMGKKTLQMFESFNEDLKKRVES